MACHEARKKGNNAIHVEIAKLDRFNDLPEPFDNTPPAKVNFVPKAFESNKPSIHRNGYSEFILITNYPCLPITLWVNCWTPKDLLKLPERPNTSSKGTGGLWKTNYSGLPFNMFVYHQFLRILTYFNQFTDFDNHLPLKIVGTYHPWPPHWGRRADAGASNSRGATWFCKTTWVLRWKTTKFLRSGSFGHWKGSVIDPSGGHFEEPGASLRRFLRYLSPTCFKTTCLIIYYIISKWE